jgi:hypothetical protein
MKCGAGYVFRAAILAWIVRKEAANVSKTLSYAKTDKKKAEIGQVGYDICPIVIHK